MPTNHSQRPDLYIYQFIHIKEYNSVITCHTTATFQAVMNKLDTIETVRRW